MRRTGERHRVHVEACEVCGRLPHPSRSRLALTKIAAAFPVELVLHALVVDLRLPYLRTVMLLAVSATIMVVWVVEPSAMRLFGRWLHGPELHKRNQPRHNHAMSRATRTRDAIRQSRTRW